MRVFRKSVVSCDLLSLCRHTFFRFLLGPSPVIVPRLSSHIVRVVLGIVVVFGEQRGNQRVCGLVIYLRHDHSLGGE